MIAAVASATTTTTTTTTFFQGFGVANEYFGDCEVA
jgi:hypothetical protein